MPPACQRLAPCTRSSVWSLLPISAVLWLPEGVHSRPSRDPGGGAGPAVAPQPALDLMPRHPAALLERTGVSALARCQRVVVSAWAFALAAAHLLLFPTVACNLEPATVFQQLLCGLEARALCSSAPCGILPCVLALCLFGFE